MPSVVIDACCLIDLLASGHAQEILLACGHTWFLPTAVKDEVRFIRQADPTDPNKLVPAPIDLRPFLTAGVLKSCEAENSCEQDLFTRYATQFRSDGEAMCLAIAECRNWTIATDDRKAIRVARQAGLSVLSSPELVKAWADADAPDQTTLITVLTNIQVFAQFRPNVSMAECQWWLDQLKVT